MQFNTVKYIYPKPSSYSGQHSAMYVGEDNVEKFNDEFYRLKLESYLPCASIAYSVNHPNSSGEVYVDVGFALRNPEDRWDRKIGRTLAQQRLDELKAGGIGKYAFSFDLKEALKHTFGYIKDTIDVRKFAQWEALSYGALQDIVVDHVESWNSYLHGWEEDTDILFDIVNYEGKL